MAGAEELNWLIDETVLGLIGIDLKLGFGDLSGG